jgi:hypothetical protein
LRKKYRVPKLKIKNLLLVLRALYFFCEWNSV